MTLVLRYAARSDRGLIRGNNQDSVYAGPRLLAVADGMGGHAAGDVASKVVIAALEHLDADAPSGDMLQALREAVFDGSEHLREVIREAPQLEGMERIEVVTRASAGKSTENTTRSAGK